MPAVSNTSGIGDTVAAVIAAAGFSRRMGRFKQLLPWGDSTVIAAVVENLFQAGACPVVCVVGHRRAEVQAALQHTSAWTVYNPDYAQGEMLDSYQAGVRALMAPAAAGSPAEERAPESVCLTETRSSVGCLLALGDQPHIPVAVIRRVLQQARSTPQAVVIPSHNMRRGHPIYLPRRLWLELLTLGQEESLRHLLRRHENEIIYIPVEDDAILRDMDTPGEYAELQRQKKQEE